MFLIHWCLLCGLNAQNPVTEAETKVAAVRYAQLFLQYKNLSLSNIKTVYLYEEESYTLMREVLFDNGLSILFSAYKSCQPVLLYSTNNTTVLSDIENIPDGLHDFIQNYAGAITYAAGWSRNLDEHPEWHTLLDTTNTAKDNRAGTNIYGPLITTVWGQTGSYYGYVQNAFNHFVPKTDDDCTNDTCPTGCVATAMAQIMKYWNYPVYMPNKVEQYDWCNMTDTLYRKRVDTVTNTYITNNNFEIERDAIARLMADCGQAANMHYCFYLCNSFTFPIDARNALVDTFGYHSDAIRRLRSSHSTKTWKSFLVNDIKAGRPVLYAGISWKSEEFYRDGHAFVCDGYNENTDKFHFNWGHSGSHNEVWCTIDSIIEGNYNWNHLERAVFNIHPGTTQDYCNFEMPLWTHYYYYYNIYGNTTPDPYANVPKTFTRLISVPNGYQSSWRTIPSGATSEYVAHEEVILQDGFLAETGSDFYAHIAPCESCDDRMMVPGEKSDVSGEGNENPADTLAAPKSWQAEVTQSGETYLNVYPNPTDDLLYVELSGAGIAAVALYDLQGRMVYSQTPDDLPAATVNMRNIPAGVYLLRVTDTNGKEYQQKIVRR